jgi:hypothetical protein
MPGMWHPRLQATDFHQHAFAEVAGKPETGVTIPTNQVHLIYFL